MSQHLPCSFADYQNTRWHRRLVSGEFVLQFDQYPDREVIVDHLSDQQESWKERIRMICTQDDESWNKLSPGELVEILRKERQQFISTSKLHWHTSSFCFKNEDTNHVISESTTIASNYRMFIFPDIYDACPLDTQVAILSHSQKDCIVCIPEDHKNLKHMIPGYKVKLLANPSMLTVEELREMGNSGSIICADVWYALAFLNAGVSVLSYLDKREWFASVVLKENTYEECVPALPENTRYGNLLTVVKNNRPMRSFQMLSDSAYSGIYADLEEPCMLPNWVQQAREKKVLDLEMGFYEKQQGTWVRVEHPNKNTIHTAFSSFAKEKISLKPYLFSGKHSPLSLSFPEGGFFTSFNYYFTDNLKSWYAKVDKRPLPWNDFLLDYLAFPLEDSLYESVPLYNKALLGYGKDGSFFTCTGEWTHITLTLDETESFVFSKEADNAKTPQHNPNKIYFPSEREPVGEGMWCLTFIHDYLWDACEGPVRVPPFGVVVTTRQRIERVEKAAWSVNWKDLPLQKSEVAWLVGGFNLLIKDGKNLVASDDDTYAQLQKEGWFTPSSIQTQETMLDVLGVQPRSVIGYGNGKIMVLSVSGRNCKSEGITFSDAASLSAQVFRRITKSPLDFLVNLDGGASSVLGCKKDGEASCLLTKPSPSITNPAGCPRCVPSLLTIQLKQGKNI